MPPSYFHCAEAGLQLHTVISPGRYGEKFFEIGPSHARWVCEIAYEWVRLEHFPALPSRLYCNYVLESLDAAKFWKERQVKAYGIYSVSLLDPSLPSHRTDFNLIQPLLTTNDTIIQAALRYWKAATWTNIKEYPGLKCVEVLTASPIRIEKVQN